MPTFRHRKRPLVGFAAFKDHCSFFPMSLEAMATHAKDLKPYRWPLSDACGSRVLPVTEGAR